MGWGVQLGSHRKGVRQARVRQGTKGRKPLCSSTEEPLLSVMPMFPVSQHLPKGQGSTLTTSAISVLNCLLLNVVKKHFIRT